jgi:hypothetical protein
MTRKHESKLKFMMIKKYFRYGFTDRGSNYLEMIEAQKESKGLYDLFGNVKCFSE